MTSRTFSDADLFRSSLRQSVYRNRVIAALYPRFGVPCGEAFVESEAGGLGEFVVAAERESRGAQLEAGDDEAAGLQVASEVGEDASFAARREEDHDVAGHEDGVEFTAQRDRFEVGDVPFELRRFAHAGSEHDWVEVNADDVEAAGGEFAGDAASATSSVEDGLQRVATEEVGLAVDILAGGGALFVDRVVGVAVLTAGGDPGVGLVWHWAIVAATR